MYITALAHRTISLWGRGISATQLVKELLHALLEDHLSYCKVITQTSPSLLGGIDKALQFLSPVMQTREKVVGAKKSQLKKSTEGSGRGPIASKHLQSKRKPVSAHDIGGGDRPLPLLDVSAVAKQLADDDINQSKDEFVQYVPPTPPPKRIKGRKSARKSVKAHNKENIPQTLEDRQAWFGFQAGMLNNFGKQSMHSEKENQGDANASLIRFKKSKQTIYSVNTGGNKMLVTCDEYKALNPQRTNLPTSVMAHENRDIAHIIRWNISDHYREQGWHTTQHCRWK